MLKEEIESLKDEGDRLFNTIEMRKIRERKRELKKKALEEKKLKEEDDDSDDDNEDSYDDQEEDAYKNLTLEDLQEDFKDLKLRYE